MKVAYWIQEADYSAQDFDPVDLSAALPAVHAQDWAPRLTRFRQMETAGQDCCPPGIGFTRPTRPTRPIAEFLQLCPADDGSWTVFYQHPDRRIDASLMGEGATDGAVVTALHAFFADDRPGVEAAIERFVP